MDTGNLDLYEYRDLTYRRIRLLTVLPRAVDGPPRVWLEHVDLAEVVNEYNAISYTWGTDDETHRIIINDRSAWVSTNAYLLLTHFHSTGLAQNPHPRLWIDSICINQQSLNEKNQQVRLMGEIYSLAKQTVIWLDRSSLFAEIAPTFIEMLNKEPEGSVENLWRNLSVRMRNVSPSDTENTVAAELWSLFNHPYWRRLWIVQEAILGRETKLMIMGVLHPLEAWAHAWEFEQRFYRILSSEDKILFDQYHANMHYLRTLLHYRAIPAARSLAGLVKTFQRYECRERKDMIYGLLGLADDADQLPIDYGRPIVELFFDVLEVTYPAEDSKEQLHEIGKLFEVLQISWADLFVYLHTAEPAVRKRLLSRVFPVHLEVSQSFSFEAISSRDGQSPLSLTKSLETTSGHVCRLLLCQTLDKSIPPYLVFLQTRNALLQFICLASAQILTSTGDTNGSPERKSFTPKHRSVVRPSLSPVRDDDATTSESLWLPQDFQEGSKITCQCSAWEVSLLHGLAGAGDKTESSMTSNIGNDFTLRAKNQEELIEFAVRWLQQNPEMVDPQLEDLNLRPKVVTNLAGSSIASEHLTKPANDVTVPYSSNNLSRGDRIRERTVYWQATRRHRAVTTKPSWARTRPEATHSDTFSRSRGIPWK